MPVTKAFARLWGKANSRWRLLGFILVILAIGSTLQVYYTNQVRRELMTCQTQFIDQMVTAIESRSEVNKNANDALESLISGLKDAEDSLYTEILYEEYLDRRAEQRETLKDHPLPTIKLSEYCYSDIE